MPEYRRDPLSGRWCIIAERRAARPHQFDEADGGIDERKPTSDAPREDCPFCRGNEAETPPEIDVDRPVEGTPGDDTWRVRVVPNKYPAVERIEEEASIDCDDLEWISEEAWQHSRDHQLAYTAIPGLGEHEVIIDTPRHVLSLSDLDDGEAERVFRMYTRRLRALSEKGCWKHALLFKNVGRSAGASLPHTHTQLMATPFVLPTVHNEMQRARRYLQKHGTCLACDYLERELRHEVRVVEVTDLYVVMCPYAPRFPMEVSILPRQHHTRFEYTPDDQLAELARLARRTVLRLEKAVPHRSLPLAYNMIFYSAPFTPIERYDYHWRILVMPSLAKAAGFEWGSGLHINPFSPEKTAERLRSLFQEL